MLPQSLNDQLLTELRSSATRLLIEQGQSQSQIAGVLGISQAMVSKYLLRPPQNRLPEPMATDVEVAARKLARAQDRSMSMVEAHLSIKLSLRDLHGYPQELELSIALTTPEDPEGKVLTQLQEAARRASQMDLKVVTPQVHINLAMAVPGAEEPHQVAAFPGRFVALHGRSAPTTPPTFGASGHLARLLLKTLPHQPEIRAICNLRYSSLVAEALKELKWSSIKLRHTQDGLQLPASQPSGEIFVDEGGFGREPALYVLGRDAGEVMLKVAELVQAIKREQKRMEDMELKQ